MKRFAILMVLVLASLAAAQQELTSGSTDEYVYFVAVDATDLHTREPGLISGDFTIKYSLNGTSFTTMTTPTVTELTGGDGEYSILADEAGMTTLAAGKDQANMAIRVTHASIDPVTLSTVVKRPKITAGATSVAQTGDAYGPALAAQTAAEKIDTSTELRTLLAGSDTALATAANQTTILGYVDGIEAKTNNLPASPAAVGSAMTLTIAYDNAKTALTPATIYAGTRTWDNLAKCLDAFLLGRVTSEDNGTTNTLSFYGPDNATVQYEITVDETNGLRAIGGELDP